MVFDRAASLYRSTVCPVNTYGVMVRTYGLKFTPCRPCPRGLVTNGLDMQISEANCTNKDGWGFNGFTAEVCGPGYYATGNSRMPCTQCPPNRNTTSGNNDMTYFLDAVSALPLPDNAGTDQNGIEDCKVIAGYGVDAESLSGLTDAQLAVADTVECEVGKYGAGGELSSICTACPYFRTTNRTGSVTVDDCYCESVLVACFALENAARFIAWTFLQAASLCLCSFPKTLCKSTSHDMHCLPQTCWIDSVKGSEEEADPLKGPGEENHMAAAPIAEAGDVPCLLHSDAAAASHLYVLLQCVWLAMAWV